MTDPPSNSLVASQEQHRAQMLLPGQSQTKPVAGSLSFGVFSSNTHKAPLCIAAWVGHKAVTVSTKTCAGRISSQAFESRRKEPHSNQIRDSSTGQCLPHDGTDHEIKNCTMGKRRWRSARNGLVQQISSAAKVTTARNRAARNLTNWKGLAVNTQDHSRTGVSCES